MTPSITVRNLSINKYSTDKYVIVSMFFFEKNKNDIVVKTKIIRKIYLINNFKANMLIENDVLKFEKFNIITLTFSIYIDNCKITISIFIKHRFTFQTASVHLTKTYVILLHIEINIFIHRITLSKRDYLFEFAKANFLIYFHIVNIAINTVLIRNGNNNFVKIFKNFRLNKLFELKHFNTFYVNFKFSNFIIRRFKAKHKDFFFKKVLNFTILTITNLFFVDIILDNDVIIHDFL